MKEIQPPEYVKTKRDFAIEEGLPVEPDPDWTDQERAYNAQKLKMAGFSYAEIATICGFTNGKNVDMVLRQFYQREAIARDEYFREQILELQMQRTEELIKAYWPTAMAGEVKHAEFVLKVIGQENKQLGLEELMSTSAQNTSRTVIISGDPEQFAKQLQQFVEDDSV